MRSQQYGIVQKSLSTRRQLKIYRTSEQIRQTIPARVDYNSGIIIEPHILERPKIKSKAKVTKTEPFYKTVIKQIDKVPQMFITPLEVSMSARPEQEWTYPTYETEIRGAIRFAEIRFTAGGSGC